MRKIRIAVLLLLVLGAGAGYALLRYVTGDRFLREQILAKLAEHYSQFDVSLSRARLDLPNGLLYLDRLAFTSRESAAEGRLVTVPEIEVRVDRQKFRRGKLKARQITLNHPRLRAERLPDGRWDVSDLLPLPRFSESPPEVFIRGGTIELYDEQGPSPRKLVLRDVHLRFIPDSQRRFDFSGSFRGAHLSLAHLEGHFDADSQEWLVAGLIEKLSLGSPLLDDLPAPLAEKLEPLRGITAPVEVHYRLAQAGLEGPIRFECEAVLESGRLEAPGLPWSLKTLTAGSVLYRDGQIKGELRGRDGILFDSRLPFDLHDVTASISIEEDRIEGRLTGRNGVTKVQADLAFEPGDLTLPTRVTGEVSHLPLDDRVYAKLTPELRAIWDRFSPAGEANLSFRFSREENTWHRQVVLTSLGGAFQFDKFPYPLTGVTGTVRDEQDRIDVDLRARAGGKPVTVRARIEHPGPEAKVVVWIAANQVRIDRKFLAALPQPSRDVLGRMNPKGFFDVRAVFQREAGEAKTYRRSLNFTLKDCSMRHEGFPYPLTQITGTVTEKNRSWRFHELRGYNGTAEVVANGTLEPPEGGGRFDLQLTASAVPFEEELRAALSPQWASVWDQCAPKGTADVVAQLQHRPGRPCRVTSLALRLDGASVRLRAFPYRWDNVKANLDLEDGQAVIRDLTAQHEGVHLRTNGRVASVPSGGYVVRLEGLDAENLQLDRTLLDALPDQLANLSEHLELEGPVDLQDTAFEFYWSGRDGDAVQARWNVGVQLSDNSFRCGQRLDHVNGLIEIGGNFDGKVAQGHGKFELGSLSLKGVQLTRLTGPFQWVGEDLVFGSDVWRTGTRRPEGQGQEHLHARLLGGVITVDAVVRGDPANYQLKASLRGARLERYAKEYMPDRQRLRGELSGHLHLSGRVEGAVRPQGHGAFRIRQGDLYELPLVLALLKIPSLQFPDNTAFTEAKAEFRFTSDKIDIKSIRLFGDAVTLRGRGKASYDRKIDLTFYTMVGRDTVRVPFLTDLFRGASEQLLAIRVTGRFESPRASPEIVPQVTDAMRQFLGVRRTR